jgi:hypothetical protein
MQRGFHFDHIRGADNESRSHYTMVNKSTGE